MYISNFWNKTIYYEYRSVTYFLVKSKVMKESFKKFKQNSNSNTITGLFEKAEGILSKAVELWHILLTFFSLISDGLGSVLYLPN